MKSELKSSGKKDKETPTSTNLMKLKISRLKEEVHDGLLDLSSKRLQRLPEALPELTEVTRLSIANNSVTSFTPGFFNLIRLEELIAFNNEITELPNDFGVFTNLRTLNLETNQLTALPDSICLLTHLEVISLANNRVSKLPENIGKLVNLQRLIMENNALEVLPNSMENLTNLVSLELYYNRLTQLPAWVGKFHLLTALLLDGNKISELPDLSALNDLEHLDIRGNQITQIPKYLITLPKLQKIGVAGNPFKYEKSIVDSWNKLDMDRSYEELKKSITEVVNQ